jgi:hypothetical protein
MSAPTEPLTITQPGVFDIPAEDYHLDPVPGGSLSSSGARKLLAPSCPALYRYEQDNPPPPKKTFDLGHAAHRMVLGAGAKPVLVDAERWDTKVIKAEVADIRERGDIPLKRAEFDKVKAMAAALREHEAARLFEPGTGHAEQSLFWTDQPTGVRRRARLDWLPAFNDGRRMLLPDYKSCASAEPDALAKAMDTYGYHCQGAWYLDAVRALGLAGEDAAFLLIAQEKTPPYIVTVIEPDAMAIRIAHARNREAIELYAECVASGRWPGYADDVVLTPLPPWTVNRWLEEIAS